jgi:hypothetical protein
MELYKLNEIEQQMSDDLDWAEEAPEVQQHHGKLVVVYKKQVLAVGTDQDALLREAADKAQCSLDDLVVVVVPAVDVFEVPD